MYSIPPRVRRKRQCLQQLKITDHRGQRRAQIMGDAGHRLPQFAISPLVPEAFTAKLAQFAVERVRQTTQLAVPGGNCEQRIGLLCETLAQTFAQLTRSPAQKNHLDAQDVYKRQVLAILVLAPSAAALLPPFFLIPLHFTAFFALLYMTTQRPEMGNGGLYSFAYIYLTGNPVFGEALVRRGLLALTGYFICGAILFAKHRNQHRTIRFLHVIRGFDLSSPVYVWQLRMALGVSLVMTAGQVFGVERFMWMGFACASLLSEYPYSGSTLIRFRHRIVGAVAGSFAFFVIYLATPEAFHPLMGCLLYTSFVKTRPRYNGTPFAL